MWSAIGRRGWPYLPTVSRRCPSGNRRLVRRRPTDKRCDECAAKPGQPCAAAEGNGADMPDTHALPKGDTGPTDKELRDLYSLSIAELTVKRVLDVTRPEGIEARTWAEIVGQTSQANREWDESEGANTDPWADGSAGWEEFCPQLETEPLSEPVPVVWTRIDANRLDFRIAVGKVFPTTGPLSTRGSILLAHANYGDDAGENVYPSNSTIAKKLGLARQTVNEHVRWAVKAGWLRRTGVMGRTKIYRLTRPDTEDRG